MLKFFYYCLDIEEKEQNLVFKRLNEFCHLMKAPPVAVTLEIKPLSPSLVKVFKKIYDSWCSNDLPFCYFCKHIRTEFDSIDLKGIPLLVYCKDNSKLAIAAVKENPLAEWGLMNDQFAVSAVYKPGNKYLLWHETLHLFDACDCYCYCKPGAGSNCELSNCIMQYKPTKDNVGEWPFLCGKNIKRIRAWSKKHKLNNSV